MSLKIRRLAAAAASVTALLGLPAIAAMAPAAQPAVAAAVVHQPARDTWT